MELKQAAHSHFHQLFSEDGVSDSSVKLEFLSNIPALVSVETNVGLIKPFFLNKKWWMLSRVWS